MNKLLTALLLVISIPAFAQTAQYYGSNFEPAGSSITYLDSYGGVTQFYDRSGQPNGSKILAPPVEYKDNWADLRDSTPTPGQYSPADNFYKAMGR